MKASPATNLAERSGRALGSPLRLVLAGSNADADRAWSAIERVFAEVDAAMSRFREDSALTHLCRRSPEAVGDLPRMLVRALVAADRARRITGGTFEPRIVEALERIGYIGVPQRSSPRIPVNPGIDPTRILVREGRTGPIALPVPVDLGGIGKGLALRWAAGMIDELARDRPEAPMGYLLDAGGDIVAAGVPATDQAWSIGIEDPAGKPDPLAVLEVVGRGAVATSSTTRLRWEVEGRTVHHLIDPRTGEPGGDGLTAVTVAGLDPAWAEVWSKSLFLEGAARIAAAARRRGLAAWWVTADGLLEMTPAARQRTSWVRAER